MVIGKCWEVFIFLLLFFVQVFLGFMIFGIYIGFGDDFMWLGSNFMMLFWDMVDVLIFQSVDYVF